MTEEINTTKDLSFHSQKAISIATFIGGPMAAGYLIRENFIALNKPDEGRNALLLSIIATIILFGGILLIPENIIEKIPNQILPLVYSGIIYLIVEKIHGPILKEHKANNNTFFSGWKAAGIGFISLLILATIMFGYIFLAPEAEEYELYSAKIEQFSKNENESLIFYDHLSTNSNAELISELNDSFIPKWKENITIIQSSNQIANLPSELRHQNEILLEYSRLRLEASELFKSALLLDTEIYGEELEKIHAQIDEQLSKLD